MGFWYSHLEMFYYITLISRQKRSLNVIQNTVVEAVVCVITVLILLAALQL